MANSNNQTFSDIIGDDYKKWHSSKIILDGGTGTGKTYFILNRLAKYAKKNGKKILYLCNRSALKKQVQIEVEHLNLDKTIIVDTYQRIQGELAKGHKLIPYAYIIADECHYFMDDALFNEHTDLIYRYIEGCDKSNVIYISATAKVYFLWLRNKNTVPPENYYNIPKSYDYVDKIYFYDKKFLIPKIDAILAEEPDTKVLVFCNSADRVLELYEHYGRTALYYASKSNRRLANIHTDKCIYEHTDGTVTFDSQLLVTTKVLDNGIDIKDKRLKHIFCEILDVDSCIQSLGRKRKISDDDKCMFYIKEYSPQSIQAMINSINYKIEPAEMWLFNYNGFCQKYGKDISRKRIRNNDIFYTKFSTDKSKNELKVNPMRLKKYLMDKRVLKKMKDTSYRNVLTEIFDSEVAGKTETLDIAIKQKDEFLEYLHSMEGKYLYSDERREIAKQFEKIGVKLRRPGINTLNGALQDYYGNKYKCRFRNKEIDKNSKLTSKALVDYRKILPNRTANPHRKKAYWLLE